MEESARASSRLEWLEPWVPVEPAHAAGLEEELRREVARGHVLFGRTALAIARRNDQDDVLFEVAGTSELAVVHLTCASRPERPPWPQAQVFPDLEAFAEERMRADHEGWAGR